MKYNFNKIEFVIGKEYRGIIIFLIVLLLFGMLMEIIGLGSIIPLLSVISSPESIAEIPFLSTNNLTSQLEYKSLVSVLLILVVFIYIFKSLFLSYLVYRQNRFLANVVASISNRLFSKYLNQPFDFHINNNSSYLIKNSQTEVKMFGIYQSALLSIFVELGLLSSILLNLIFIEPLGAIFVGGFLGLLAMVFYSISKKKLLLWGILE